MCREKWALWPQFRKLPTQEWLFKGPIYDLPSEDDVRIGTDLSGWGCWVGSPRECPTLYMIWLWIDPGLPTLTRAWTPSQRRCDPTSSSSHRPRSPRPWWSPPLSLSETASLQLSRPFVILLPLVLILLLLTLWRSTLTHSPKISTFTQNTIYPDYPPPSPTGLHSLSDDWHTLTHKIRSSFLFPFLGNNKWSADIEGQTSTAPACKIFDGSIGDVFVKFVQNPSVELPTKKNTNISNQYLFLFYHTVILWGHRFFPYQ